MPDSVVVEAIVAGDPAGIGEAYDRYAAPLYAYCRSLLDEPGDPDDAADAAGAVRDTFAVGASRIAELRDPDALRPWLYAVARNECRRRIRAREPAQEPEEAPEETVEVIDLTGNADAAIEPLDPRTLVRSAIPGLDPGEQEVLELRLGLGPDSAEIASVLGISRKHAHALLSRAYDQLEIALGVLLVTRTGRPDCPALDELLAGWDGELTPLWRARISRHVERCEACTVRRYRELRPAVRPVISPADALSLDELPAGFRDEVLTLATGDAPDAVAYRAAVGQRTGPFGRHGFPKPLDPPKPRRHRGRTVAAVAGAAAAAAVIAAVLAGGAHHAGPSPAGADPRLTSGVGGGQVGGADPGRHGRPVRRGNPVTAAGSASPSPAAGTSASPATRSPAASPSAPGPSPSSPPPSTSGPPPAGQGTLSVSPTSIALSSQSSTLTLTARSGPVHWTITEPSGLVGELVVAPSSGALASGRSTRVTVTGSGLASLDTQLTANPGNVTITVLIGLGLTARGG